MKKVNLSKEQIKEVIELYTIKKFSIKKIADKFQLSNIPITRILKENGVKIVNNTQFVKKYSLNEQYFKDIDTEDKAYYLGYLYADGYVSIKRNSVTLTLQEEDLPIIEKFKDVINTNKPIYTIKPPKKFLHRKVLKTLMIVNKYFYKHLIDKGCLNNKSFILEFPTQVPDNLIHHFIRGYFDGDGCIWYKNGKNPCVEIVGTEMFLTCLQDLLINKIGLNKTKLSCRFPNRNNTTRTLRFSSKKDVQNFKDFIYSNATIYLERKKTKF